MSFLRNLFKSKINNGFYLMVDVGSESIGAAFVEFKINNDPIVHSEIRQIIPFQENINMDRYIVLLQDTLKKVINDNTLNNLNITPKSVIFTLASPWYKSETRSIHIEEEKDFTINEIGLNAILAKEKELFLEDKKTIKNISAIKEEIIEAYITQIKINGYEIRTPINRKTTNADISIHIATSFSKIIDSLKIVVLDKWVNTNCVFHSFIFSAFNTVKQNFEDSSSYIIIDIAGEITDVSLIRDNIILKSISFPIGYRSFARSLVKKLNLQIDIANSEVILFFKNELSAERMKVFEEIFEKMSHDWAILFTASIKQLSLKYPIPRNIYLLTNTEFTDYFIKSIKSSSIDIFGENQENFRINLLTNNTKSSENICLTSNCKDLFLCVTISMLDKLLSIENKHNKK